MIIDIEEQLLKNLADVEREELPAQLRADAERIIAIMNKGSHHEVQS